MHQFQIICTNSDKLEEAFLMGHRLSAFLSTALPQHPHYLSKTVTEQRNKTFSYMVRIQQEMESLELQIDELELSNYIQYYCPSDDDESSCSDLDQPSVSPTSYWEAFPGWGFDCENNLPALNDTDVSSLNSSTEPNGSAEEPHFLHSGLEDDALLDPELTELLAFDDDNSSYASNEFYLHDTSATTSFLKTIAEQDVHYESDSDAVDSWMQNDDFAESHVSSQTLGLTCDPARIAFRELMHRAKMTTQGWKLSSTPTTRLPSASARHSETDLFLEEFSHSAFTNEKEWATFDFASVQQRVN
jgi:hypothetical protein